MRKLILVAIAASTPAYAAPPPPAPIVVTSGEHAEAPTWRKHKCQRSVLVGYPGPDRDSIPADERYVSEELEFRPGRDYDPANPRTVGGNATLDDKLAAVNKKRASRGVCDTRHRDALEDGILRRKPPAPATSSRATAKTIAHADLVRSVLALTPGEEARLARDGLVVPERLQYENYTQAYYDIHRGQLPVYVSVDSIMHAVFASHDQFVANLETEQMMGKLDEVLGAMHCGLTAAASSYPPAIAHDVDLYLTVARSLLAGQPVLSELGHADQAAADLVQLITASDTLAAIELFGRTRALDTTAFTPRGHYDGVLAPYFRAAMWLSRVDLTLSARDSRSSTVGLEPDPTETPREAVAALALADLAKRTRALDKIAVLDRAWAVLAGKREDVSFAELVKLRAEAKIGPLSLASAEQLRKTIGDRFRRTVNTGPTPNVDRLPVISTLLGARITPDTTAVGGLIDGRGPAFLPVELGFMLGHDRARVHASAPEPKLATARTQLASDLQTPDLYSAWLAAIITLSHRPVGTTPSFMDTAAFSDLRLNTGLAAYGQLRHNHVLVAAQAYDQGGCEIPDGYVEPAPSTYTALAEYARRGATTFRALDPRDAGKGVAYFTRLEKIMRVLARISHEELANKPLSADTKRFLAMIVERRVANAMSYGGTFPVATFDGWYLDLFPSIDSALESPAFVADIATFRREGYEGVHYLGAKSPRLGVFVVDVGGAPRWMVGPVARAFQYTGPLSTRSTDADAKTLGGTEPWAKSYTAPAIETPAFELEFTRTGASGRRMHGLDATAPPNTVRIESAVPHGDATIELLDHHFVKMAEVRVAIVKGVVDATAPATPQPIEALRIRIGAFSARYDLSLEGVGRWTSK